MITQQRILHEWRKLAQWQYVCIPFATFLSVLNLMMLHSNPGKGHTECQHSNPWHYELLPGERVPTQIPPPLSDWPHSKFLTHDLRRNKSIPSSWFSVKVMRLPHHGWTPPQTAMPAIETANPQEGESINKFRWNRLSNTSTQKNARLTPPAESTRH